MLRASLVGTGAVTSLTAEASLYICLVSQGSGANAILDAYLVQTASAWPGEKLIRIYTWYEPISRSVESDSDGTAIPGDPFCPPAEAADLN